MIRRNRRGEKVGVYAVCSAHPSVIAAAVQQAVDDDSVLHIESTSSQVNQFGGYSGQTPSQFADRLFIPQHNTLDFPRERVLLGGDHLGPYPWRDQPSAVAMNKALRPGSCLRARRVQQDSSRRKHGLRR